ncbi:MAG: hypothetical protein II748_01475 [Clostridia bacterium]|nr:hypothetical protein [Clostridia bacterium]
MLVKDARANRGFFLIMTILKKCRQDGIITKEEYERAEAYYRKLLKAEIIFFYKDPKVHKN